MTGALRHTVRAVAPLSAVALLAGLGFPAIAFVAGVVVLVLMAACWVLSDKDRSDRLARIILGIRGNAHCLDRADAGVALPAPASGAPSCSRTCQEPLEPTDRRAAGTQKPPPGSGIRAAVSDACPGPASGRVVPGNLLGSASALGRRQLLGDGLQVHGVDHLRAFGHRLVPPNTRRTSQPGNLAFTA